MKKKEARSNGDPAVVGYHETLASVARDATRRTSRLRRKIDRVETDRRTTEDPPPAPESGERELAEGDRPTKN